MIDDDYDDDDKARVNGDHHDDWVNDYDNDDADERSK
jgi:hypothetical protein